MAGAPCGRCKRNLPCPLGLLLLRQGSFLLVPGHPGVQTIPVTAHSITMQLTLHSRVSGSSRSLAGITSLGHFAAPAAQRPLHPATHAGQHRLRPTRLHVASVERPAVALSQEANVQPVSEEVAAKMAELGLDLETSGLKYLSNDARVSCLRWIANEVVS